MDQTAYRPQYGMPFFHLNYLLLPDEIRCLLLHPDNIKNCHYDEFGFVVDTATSPVNGEHKQNDPIDPIEDEKHYKEVKSKWINYLEHEYEKLAPSSCLDMSQFDADIERLPILDELICFGITNELRPFFWLRFSKSLLLKVKSKWSFTQLSDLSSDIISLSNQQVSQVLPNNVCFISPTSVCSKRLKHILRIIKWYQKTNLNDTKDCQLNLSLIGAYLLLVCIEEDAFWLLLKISSNLNINECIFVVNQIMDKCCPIVSNLLKKHEIEFDVIASNWFSSLFAGIIPNARLLFILWDFYFYEGPIFLVQITVGLLIIETKLLETCSDSADFFNSLSDLPSKSFGSLETIINAWKTGKNIVKNLNFPDTLFNYEPKSQLSIVNNMPAEKEAVKLKNVKQTSLIMNLHESIVAIAHHFKAYNLNAKYKLDADYDNVDTVDSKEDLVNRLRSYKKRAKALIDFKCNDSDELGFFKNDIITVINEKDEHCWIGELNGQIGWFPAKFVEILDERDQDYSIAGDDRVVPFVNDLVRGKLCSALKSILTYDMKKSYFFSIHPWTIIEEISNMCTNSDFKSIYSRLILTKTFRLDEYTRVLTPCELLYRSIALINKTHTSLPMDIKFRSLVCLGLNQYVLHDWFELICTNQPSIINKSYGVSSFLTTPAWKIIKAELKYDDPIHSQIKFIFY